MLVEVTVRGRMDEIYDTCGSNLVLGSDSRDHTMMVRYSTSYRSPPAPRMHPPQMLPSNTHRGGIRTQSEAIDYARTPYWRRTFRVYAWLP